MHGHSETFLLVPTLGAVRHASKRVLQRLDQKVGIDGGKDERGAPSSTRLCIVIVFRPVRR